MFSYFFLSSSFFVCSCEAQLGSIMLCMAAQVIFHTVSLILYGDAVWISALAFNRETLIGPMGTLQLKGQNFKCCVALTATPRVHC